MDFKKELLEFIDNIDDGVLGDGVDWVLDEIKKKIEELWPEKKLGQFTIYADGACSGNPGLGGYGYVIIDDLGCVTEGNGFEPSTTNNRMELLSAIQAINCGTKLHCKVHVITDSEYVVKGMNEWIKNWKKNNWRTANKKPVKNQDLWIFLDSTCSQRQVTFEWTKGHSDNEYNNRADELAAQAIEYNR